MTTNLKSMKREIDRVMEYTYDTDGDAHAARQLLYRMIDQLWLNDQLSATERGILLQRVTSS